MALYEFTDDALVEIEATTFREKQVTERGDLQRILRDHFEKIDESILIIAEEFSDWQDSSRRIDLLGVDTDGQLIVIELKRGRRGGHADLQTIRYAAMIAGMTFEDAVDVFRRYLHGRGKNPADAESRLLAHIGDDPENFASEVAIMLIAADFQDRELTSAVLWLNEHDLDIRCVRLNPYHLDGRLILDVRQIIPVPEASGYIVRINEKAAEERRITRRKQSWTGFYFVNVGMDSPDEPLSFGRHWEHCRKYGFVAAGGGERWSRRLKKLAVGDRVFAYVSKAGYVGAGTVTRKAAPVHEFMLANGQSLRDELNAWPRQLDCDPIKQDFAVGVDWHDTVEISDARRFTGISALPNNVYRLNDQATVDFLCKQFRVPDAKSP